MSPCLFGMALSWVFEQDNLIPGLRGVLEAARVIAGGNVQMRHYPFLGK
jgi:hypothetical protein